MWLSGLNDALYVQGHVENVSARTSPTDRELVEKAWVIGAWQNAGLASGISGFVRTRPLFGGAMIELQGQVNRAGNNVGTGVVATIENVGHRPVQDQYAFLHGNKVEPGRKLRHGDSRQTTDRSSSEQVVTRRTSSSATSSADQ